MLSTGERAWGEVWEDRVIRHLRVISSTRHLFNSKDAFPFWEHNINIPPESLDPPSQAAMMVPYSREFERKVAP